MKSALAVISMLCVSLLSNAQVSDTAKRVYLNGAPSRITFPRVDLDSVTLRVRKQKEGKDLISATLLKANPSQNFAELLQKQSGIFIRQRGSGVLSTPSYKGLGTQQTPILINGANMQSSMNGTMDLSLIDAAHFGGLTLEQADASSTGAQNMGEAISLSSLHTADGLHLGIGTSTQEELSANAKYVLNKKRWYYSISAVATQSPNVVDLNHYDIDTVQANTDFQRISILQTVGYKCKRSQWTNTVYLQGSERGVPPPFFQTNNSRQADANGMMVNKYRHRTRKNWIWEAANQLWAEQIVFDNAQSGEKTDSRVLNVNTTASVSKYFSANWYAQGGVALDIANYQSQALEKNAEWNRPRVFTTIAKIYKNIRLEVNQNTIRYEGKYATSGQLKVGGGFAKKYKWNVSGQRVFRLPVLNELYWYMPGEALGNEDLKPEQGYKADVSISRFGKNLQITINPHIGKFQNWIQWVGGTEISPQNIENVMVYGVVATANHEKKFKKTRLLTQANVNYVKATYQFDNDKDTRNGMQLIYTPELTGNLTLTLAAEKFGIYINAQAVGTVYTDKDQINRIEPYQLYELGGYYEWKALRLGGVMSNVLATPYFTQPRTPLPGRILKININYIFKTNKK